MSAPVDVLAVMDAEVATLRRLESWVNEALAPTKADAESVITALVEARAAVAELIEADREFDAADAAWGGERYERDDYGVYGSDFWRCLDCEGESDAGVLNKGVTHEPGCRVEALERAVKRRAAALARVQGGAA